MEYDAYDAALHYIFKKTQNDIGPDPSSSSPSPGVSLRIATGQFRTFPYGNPDLESFESAVIGLNPVVAVKIVSAAVHAAVSNVDDEANSIYLGDDMRIQTIETMAHLPYAEKEQCAAFIRDERVLVIWSDIMRDIIPACDDMEEKLIRYVWNQRSAPGAGPYNPLAAFSTVDLSAVDPMAAQRNRRKSAVPNITMLKEKEKEHAVAAEAEKNKKETSGWWKWRVTQAQAMRQERTSITDLEKDSGTPKPRPILLYAPIYTGLAAGLSLFFIGGSVEVLLTESILSGEWTRFGLLIASPLIFCVSLFFAISVVNNIALLIGPVAQYHENSKYYSAVAPTPNSSVDNNLPHITIEMPVYKESLEQTISLSVESLKKAMQTYARQGGSCTIFVNDDGLQLLPPEEQAARIAYYADHHIGWVARPKHSSSPNGFKRAGRFKKASNMNYGLRLSLMLERHLKDLEAAGEQDGPTFEDTLEERALIMAIEEMYEETGRRFRPWASNGKAIRVGEIVLIVDSDTIVPEDCLRDAARELAESPQVAIIQHDSDVMQVANHYFENGITHFTRRINKSISLNCSNGEVAPFVGHNAFLRWSAVQDVAFIDEADGKSKIWSESNVSEDFDMALRLQMKGYIIRWATYSNRGFKEGVSLTVDDELNRWQKYAYGCDELIFHPFSEWWQKGPITKQLRFFVWCNAPIHYKIGMLSYMFSYYAIAAGFVLSLLNYILLGFGLFSDAWYLHSFEIWLASVFVYPIAGNVGYTLLEYRLGHRSLKDGLIENVTWIPFFFFFFGGISVHMSQALLAHLFSYNITWGATKKEVERSNFFKEVPKILTRFWLSLVMGTVTLAAMIILSMDFIPIGWRIDGTYWAILFPLALVAGCHILFPIVLNPWLMIFSY